MSSFTLLLLQAAEPAADSTSKGSGGLINILLLGGMVLVFWFFIMAPQRRKQKEQGSFTEGIKKGDKIATIGGIVGKVLELRTKTIVIETEGGGRLQFLRSAISFENTKALNADKEEKDDAKEDKKA